MMQKKEQKERLFFSKKYYYEKCKQKTKFKNHFYSIFKMDDAWIQKGAKGAPRILQTILFISLQKTQYICID